MTSPGANIASSSGRCVKGDPGRDELAARTKPVLESMLERRYAATPVHRLEEIALHGLALQPGLHRFKAEFGGGGVVVECYDQPLGAARADS